MTHEGNLEFAEHVDILSLDSVVLRMLRQDEAHRLTNYIVEGHSEEVAAQEK